MWEGTQIFRDIAVLSLSEVNLSMENCIVVLPISTFRFSLSSLPKNANVPVPHFAKPRPTTFGTRWTRGFVLARIVNGHACWSKTSSLYALTNFRLYSEILENFTFSWIKVWNLTLSGMCLFIGSNSVCFIWIFTWFIVYGSCCFCNITYSKK